MAVPSLAQLLRERTRAIHALAEGAPFVRRLIAGRVDRTEYARLVESLYFVYAAMETALDHHRDNPIVSRLDLRELRRLESLEKDLSYWFGPDWRTVTSPSPATCEYVARIRTVAAKEPPWLVGHLYTRYLGDLSGGEILGRAIARALGSTPDSGAAFYQFDTLADRRTLRNLYRVRLDELPIAEEARELIVEEAKRAFSLNLRLFEELDDADPTRES